MKLSYILLLVVLVITAFGLYLAYTYFMIKPAELTIDKSSIEITGCIGYAVSVKIHLTNVGGAATTAKLSLSGIKALISPESVKIDPGQTVEVEIYATVYDKASGSLTIEYDGKSIEVPVNVNGYLTEECLKNFYSYDKSLPLNPDVSLVSSTKKFEVYKVYYDSVNGQRVPALLLKPKTKPPYPYVFLIHGLGSKKEKYLNLMEFLASRGYACFAIDLPLHGERGAGKIDIEKDILNVIMQAVYDIRRGLDYLESRGDAGKICLYGTSLGGIISSITLGVEQRFSAAVLVVTGGNITYILHNSVIASGVNVDKILSNPLFPYTEPLNYISYFNGPIQFHLGEKDDVIPIEAGLQLANKAKNKEVYTYNTGHGIPANMFIDNVLDFLDRNLKS